MAQRVHLRLSKREGIEAAIGADIEPVARREQGLEVSQPGHRIAGAAAGKQRLTVVAAITVQPSVALRAEDPNDRVGAAVGRRDDRRALAAQRATPGGGKRRRLAGTDVQNRQVVVVALSGAMSTS